MKVTLKFFAANSRINREDSKDSRVRGARDNLRGEAGRHTIALVRRADIARVEPDLVAAEAEAR